MGSMKVETKKVDIDIQATEADDGTVHFDCHWRHAGGKPGVWKSGKIDLPNGPEAYELEFKLHDKSGRNLKFYGTGTPKKPEDAMYVQVGGPCPPAAGNGGGQIKFVDVDDKELEVIDANRDPPCTLKYMLRFDGDPFTGPDGTNYPPYQFDPEIRNGGGGFMASE